MSKLHRFEYETNSCQMRMIYIYNLLAYLILSGLLLKFLFIINPDNYKDPTPSITILMMSVCEDGGFAANT